MPCHAFSVRRDLNRMSIQPYVTRNVQEHQLSSHLRGVDDSEQEALRFYEHCPEEDMPVFVGGYWITVVPGRKLSDATTLSILVPHGRWRLVVFRVNGNKLRAGYLPLNDQGAANGPWCAHSAFVGLLHSVGSRTSS